MPRWRALRQAGLPAAGEARRRRGPGAGDRDPRSGCQGRAAASPIAETQLRDAEAAGRRPRHRRRRRPVPLTVNDQSLQVDKKGLFRTDIPIAADGTKVTVVAVDQGGKRATFEFMLKPQAMRNTGGTAVGAGPADEPPSAGAEP